MRRHRHMGIMPVVGALPLACAATCAASVRVQEMGMAAAVRGDATLLKQAMLHDPLAGAVYYTIFRYSYMPLPRRLATPPEARLSVDAQLYRAGAGAR